ncbi:MAG: M14-type cytosolic carboxypeptidase [Bacteroidales bacterium]|jgi:murein tripeptide amidase MpaA|nr:M14-type cytosolic carboxypeptidase [Bacteroidales bacterium]
MHISSAFDSGNIEVISAFDPQNIELNIRKDTNADFLQWFHFRIQEVMGFDLKINILNASETSFPEGWIDYQAVASYDRITWFRVPTSYDEKKLTIEFMPEYNSIYFAYFAPYSHDQHLNLLSTAQMSPNAFLVNIGTTVQGRDLDMLVIGNEEDHIKKRIWIIARQHPGESMAEWFIEGFLNRILDDSDPLSRKLLEKAVFYVIPNINPDGSILGNLRANAAGVNLNREWANPNPKTAPEVYHILQTMEQTGVDLNLDIHGDEGLPYNFISSIEGIPSYDDHLKMLDEKFSASWERISPDFQTTHGYPKNEPGKANLNVCGKAVGEKFKCLSVTMEMPFKDNADLPDEIFGWSPNRSMNLGASVLHPIAEIVDDL